MYLYTFNQFMIVGKFIFFEYYVVIFFNSVVSENFCFFYYKCTVGMVYFFIYFSLKDTCEIA